MAAREQHLEGSHIHRRIISDQLTQTGAEVSYKSSDVQYPRTQDGTSTRVTDNVSRASTVQKRLTVSVENNYVIASLLLPAMLAIPGVASMFSGSNVPLGCILIFILIAGILDNCKLIELSVATVIAGLLAFQFTAILTGAMFELPDGIDEGTL